MSDRFFYHSFPRRAAAATEGEKGLAILGSIAESGLLLTPEKTEWSEFQQDGQKSPPIKVFQKRACFTELASPELPEHSKVFGRFAIEFSIEHLRLLGAIPVFYLPTPGAEERGLAGIAAAMLARMADVQQLLTRLAQTAELCQRTPDKAELINVTLNGRIAGGTRCTIGAAEDLVAALSHQIRPPGELLNAMRAVAGFFYPTENLEYTGELASYRQREWRIIANMVRRGEEIARDLTEEEKVRLLEIDSDFFGHRMCFPTGEHRRVDQCKYMTELDQKPILTWAKRVIVPDELVDAATEVVRTHAHLVPVAGISSIMSAA